MGDKGAGGRPSDYTEEAADKICDLLAQGKSLNKICKEEDFAPALPTVLRWMHKNPEFRNKYLVAKEIAAYAMAEEIIEIADDGTNDYMEGLDQRGEPTGGWKFNAENVKRSTLRVNARQWIMARAAPKRFGEKLTQEITGADGGALKMQNVPADLSNLTAEELDALEHLTTKLGSNQAGEGAA